MIPKNDQKNYAWPKLQENYKTIENHERSTPKIERHTTVMEKKTQYKRRVSTSQTVYKFNAIPNKILTGFFMERDKSILKCI